MLLCYTICRPNCQNFVKSHEVSTHEIYATGNVQIKSQIVVLLRSICLILTKLKPTSQLITAVYQTAKQRIQTTGTQTHDHTVTAALIS